MSGHGHDDHGAGHGGGHGGHDDHGSKGPKLPHLEESLEDKINEAFDKDLEKFKEVYTKDNFIEVRNMLGEAHDSAYESFKKKFEELANDHHDPLAEKGKEISIKHQNELMLSYLKPFAEKAHGAKGKAMFESLDKMKFDGETAEFDRHAYIQKIAEELGLVNNDDPENSFYHNFKGMLNKNTERHYSGMQNLAGLVKGMTEGHHKNEIYKSTIGKGKYQKNAKLAIKALNAIGKDIQGFTGYEIEHDEHGKSKFYNKEINSFKKQLINMAENKTYSISEEQNKDHGIKYKSGGDSAGDHGHGGHDSHGGGGHGH